MARGGCSTLFFQVEKFPEAVSCSFTSEPVRNNERIPRFTLLLYSFSYF